MSTETPEVSLKRVAKGPLGITEGRIVHFQFETSPGVFVCRPAIIVNALVETNYEHGEVNLQVFLDGENDKGHGHAVCGGPGATVAPSAWKTSVPMYEPNSADFQPREKGHRLPNTWHFPERT